MKKLIASGLAISMLVTGAAFVAAQDDIPTDPPTVESTVPGGPGFGPGMGRGFGPGMGDRGLGLRMRDHADGEMIALAEEYTGLTAQEIAQAVRDGASLASLIEANGQSVDAFIEAATAQAQERITDMVYREFERPANVGAEAADLAMEYTGLSFAELTEAVRSGDTLGSLIEANGQSVEAFVGAVAALTDARIDLAVENGRLTDEQAETMKADARAQITAMVNGEYSGRGFGMGFDMFGQGRFGGRGNGFRDGQGS